MTENLKSNQRQKNTAGRERYEFQQTSFQTQQKKIVEQQFKVLNGLKTVNLELYTQQDYLSNKGKIKTLFDV